MENSNPPVSPEMEQMMKDLLKEATKGWVGK